jgi:titin
VVLVLASGGIAQAGPTDFTNRTAINSSLVSNDVRAVYVDGGGKIYAGTPYGLSTSTNGGTTFSTTLGVSLVNGIYATDDTVFAATGAGLQRSIDGGATFSSGISLGGSSTRYVTGVFARGNTVYAATTDGLWISTDGGATFPGAAAVAGFGRAVVATDDTIFFATEGSGLLYSTDGSTFTAAGGLTDPYANVVRSAAVSGNKVYAGTLVGLYVSTNGGATFAYAPTAGAGTINGVFAQDDTVYAAKGTGLLSSTDGGGSFASASTGLGSNNVLGVFARGGAVYAATAGGLGITTVAPGAPVVLSVAPLAMTASVAFTDDTPGGATTTRLEFALDDTVTVDDSTTTVTSPSTVSGLAPDTNYTLYMRTVNAAGPGAWSTGSPFTTIDFPGAPVISSVWALSTSASVAFTADDSGGSPITRLDFALDDTSTVDDSTTLLTSPFMLTGLIGSSDDTVFIRAVSAAGPGPWSVGAPFVTRPGAPAITGVAPSPTTASVAFTPAAAGGVPITRLEFALDDTNTVDDSTTSLTSPFSLTGLTAGTSYVLYMRAVNAAGAGDWSTAVPFTTSRPTPPPGPGPGQSMSPATQTLTGRVGAAVTSTSPFMLSGFSLAPTYSIYPPLPSGLYVDAATGIVSGTPTVAESGSRHWITAATAGGSQSASSSLQVSISAASPTPPRTVRVSAGEALVEVAWQASASDGGSPITAYTATATPGGRACTTTGLSCVVAGLANGTAYTISVTAANLLGTSAPTTVGPVTPSKPSIVIVGSRLRQVVSVTGATSGLLGAMVRPWIKPEGQASFAEGKAEVRVTADGSFTWSRESNKKLRVYFAHEALRSNAITFPRR